MIELLVDMILLSIVAACTFASAHSPSFAATGSDVTFCGYTLS
ncbi:hypothetical protein SM11_pD1100 (plasmid) [Sinorhizobium meliloti SM11]|uniref:Uncharacterized protein n=1 Tax=Sinorhizobium meliloti (strain SM11) TaxID=707241 RepID=F7XHA6_SINMM|nr:hypothetical protein SM11_pD1100 [Sinorhizobium meliloti SM11]